MPTVLRWSVWKSGKDVQLASVGMKVPIADRDQYFVRTWKTVFFHIPAGNGHDEIEVNIDKASFWNGTCHEVIDKRIKDWLVKSGHVPWPKGRPPKVVIEPLGNRHFAILRVDA